METLANQKKMQEWLNSNPPGELVEKVLSMIDRSSVSVNRKILRDKSYEIKRVEKIIETMKKVDLPIGPEVHEKVKSLKKEISDLEKIVPPSPQSKKK